MYFLALDFVATNTWYSDLPLLDREENWDDNSSDDHFVFARAPLLHTINDSLSESRQQ